MARDARGHPLNDAGSQAYLKQVSAVASDCRGASESSEPGAPWLERGVDPLTDATTEWALFGKMDSLSIYLRISAC